MEINQAFYMATKNNLEYIADNTILGEDMTTAFTEMVEAVKFNSTDYRKLKKRCIDVKKDFDFNVKKLVKSRAKIKHKYEISEACDEFDFWFKCLINNLDEVYEYNLKGEKHESNID